MSRFWVLEGLFKLQAVRVDWDAEARKLGYEGPRQPRRATLSPFSSAGCYIPRSGSLESRFGSGGTATPAGTSLPSS